MGTSAASRSRVSATGRRCAAPTWRCSWDFSHPVKVAAPDGITFDVPAPTQVVVRGISKQQVGETAAQIRKWRPPEPYKGKGIRYEGERVQLKVGKRA